MRGDSLSSLSTKRPVHVNMDNDNTGKILLFQDSTANLISEEDAMDAVHCYRIYLNDSRLGSSERVSPYVKIGGNSIVVTSSQKGRSKELITETIYTGDIAKIV